MPSHGDNMSGHYDVVVIGAGPAGQTAAEFGGNLGYSVGLVERDTLGGTVVTSGGAPTKTFREAAAYLSGFEKEEIYGVTLSAPPEVVYSVLLSRARKVSEQLRKLALERIRDLSVELVPGEARLDAEHGVLVRAGGAETRLRAERVIIATGSRPLRPASVPFDDPLRVRLRDHRRHRAEAPRAADSGGRRDRDRVRHDLLRAARAGHHSRRR